MPGTTDIQLATQSPRIDGMPVHSVLERRLSRSGAAPIMEGAGDDSKSQEVQSAGQAERAVAVSDALRPVPLSVLKQKGHDSGFDNFGTLTPEGAKLLVSALQGSKQFTKEKDANAIRSGVIDALVAGEKVNHWTDNIAAIKEAIAQHAISRVDDRYVKAIRPKYNGKERPGIEAEVSEIYQLAFPGANTPRDDKALNQKINAFAHTYAKEDSQYVSKLVTPLVMPLLKGKGLRDGSVVASIGGLTLGVLANAGGIAYNAGKNGVGTDVPPVEIDSTYRTIAGPALLAGGFVMGAVAKCCYEGRLDTLRQEKTDELIAHLQTDRPAITKDVFSLVQRIFELQEPKRVDEVAIGAVAGLVSGSLSYALGGGFIPSALYASGGMKLAEVFAGNANKSLGYSSSAISWLQENKEQAPFADRVQVESSLRHRAAVNSRS